MLFYTILIGVVLVSNASSAFTPTLSRQSGINMVLNADITSKIVAKLSEYGKLNDLVNEIDGLTMKTAESSLCLIAGNPQVD